MLDAHGPYDGGKGRRGNERRIKSQRSFEQAQRLVSRFSGQRVMARERTQIEIVGIEALGRFANCPRDLGSLQIRYQRTDHARGDLVLQGKDVGKTAVELLRPQMNAGSRLNELRADPQSLPRLAH